MPKGEITEGKRKRARQILALDGMWQYARQEMGDKNFHEFLNQKVDELAATLLDLGEEERGVEKLVESEGVFVPDKKPRVNQTYLRETIEPQTLNLSYLGTNNMDVPATLFKTLNDDEKIALLIGGWKLKSTWGKKYAWDSHEISERYRRNHTAFVAGINEGLKAGISECFYSLISECFNYGYPILNSSRIQTSDFEKRKQRQSRHTTPLKKRFKTIPDEDKHRFIKSVQEDVMVPEWKRDAIWYGDFLSRARKWDRDSRTFVYDPRRLAKLIYDYVIKS